MHSGGWFCIIFLKMLDFLFWVYIFEDARLLVLGKQGNMCRTHGRITKKIYFMTCDAGQYVLNILTCITGQYVQSSVTIE
jgi:hypothetical protein